MILRGKESEYIIESDSQKSFRRKNSTSRHYSADHNEKQVYFYKSIEEVPQHLQKCKCYVMLHGNARLYQWDRFCAEIPLLLTV